MKSDDDNSSEEFAYMLRKGHIERNTISDSGATCITTPRQDLMSSIRFEDETFSQANGKKIRSIGRGTVGQFEI